jgi:hypothetical protein
MVSACAAGAFQVRILAVKARKKLTQIKPTRAFLFALTCPCFDGCSLEFFLI